MRKRRGGVVCTVLSVVMPKRVGACHLVDFAVDGTASEDTRSSVDSQVRGRESLTRYVDAIGLERSGEQASSKMGKCF